MMISFFKFGLINEDQNIEYTSKVLHNKDFLVALLEHIRRFYIVKLEDNNELLTTLDILGR